MPLHRICVDVFSWILLQLGGLTLLAMGIWASVDGGSFLQLLGPFSSKAMQFVNVGFFCIAIGAVLVLLGLLGCCGAHKESKCLLLTVGVKVLVQEVSALMQSQDSRKKLFFTSCLLTNLVWSCSSNKEGHPLLQSLSGNITAVISLVAQWPQETWP